MSARTIGIALAMLVAAVPLAAQGRPPAGGLVGLYQAHLDHASDAVVLNVAAHPDD